MNQQERNRRISEGLRLAWKRRKDKAMKPVEPELPKRLSAELTPDEAQAAYDAAPAVPLSDERIQEIVAYATASPGPQTHEEARQFHEGFLSGATAYACAVGHSTLKSNNPKLCEVFDAQGWRTIETFEKLAVVPVVCEHGVKDGDWCERCNKAMKAGHSEEEPEPDTCHECGELAVGFHFGTPYCAAHYRKG